MSSRPLFKTPAFEFYGRKTVGLTVELVLILAVMASVIFALTRSAQAEEGSTPPQAPVSKSHKAQRHTTTVIDQDDEVDVPASDTTGIGTVNPETQAQKTMTAKFGSRSTSGMAGCKTEDTVQKTIRELKGDCNAWLKDRKAELKGKYLTGSCEESCDDCGMNLQRCSVNGTVHYTIGTVK